MTDARKNRNQNHPQRTRTALRMPRLLSLVAATTMAVSLVVATTPASATTAVARPFHASASGTVTPTSATTLTLDGSGIGIHLGLLDDYSGQVTVTSIDQSGVITDVLIETFTAANGDSLTIRCDQVIAIGNDGLFHGTDTWTVIGGTGRFQNASGSGNGTTVVDNLETFTKVLTGTISY